MTTNTTSNIAVNLQGFYDKRLLTRAEDNLLIQGLGQKRILPANSGSKTNFRRYNNLAPATSPLTEGVVGTGSSLSTTEVEATIAQYGDYISVSDFLDMTSLSPVITDSVDVLSYQMGESLEEIYTEAIVPNLANQITIAATAGATEATDVISVAAIKQAILALKTGKAKKFNKMIEATDKVGTTPIRASYFGIIHPDVVFDLEDQEGFIPVSQYSSQKTVHEYEVGSVKEVRFLESAKAFIDADGGNGNVDNYYTAIFGMEAFGVVVPSKENTGVIIKGAGSAGTADPLNQIAGTVGWKVATTAKILNDAFAVTIVSASSQGDNA